MLPARACSPANTFTPRRWPWLSRPLRVLPWPFLCAIAGPSGDLGHAHRGDRLAVSTAATVILASLLLEHQDLPVAPLGDDLPPHAHAVEKRGPDANRVVSRGEEHLGELH